METKELIQAVRAHATEHYGDGGWDVIVECYDDAEIRDVIGQATTPAGAIRKFRSIISVYADRQADARNSIF